MIGRGDRPCDPSNPFVTRPEEPTSKWTRFAIIPRMPASSARSAESAVGSYRSSARTRSITRISGVGAIRRSSNGFGISWVVHCRKVVVGSFAARRFWSTRIPGSSSPCPTGQVTAFALALQCIPAASTGRMYDLESLGGWDSDRVVQRVRPGLGVRVLGQGRGGMDPGRDRGRLSANLRTAAVLVNSTTSVTTCSSTCERRRRSLVG